MSKLKPNRYDVIFFSSHLDDAVFCCGGSIASLIRQNKKVLVVTVFTESHPARKVEGDIEQFLTQSGEKDAQNLFLKRRGEDKDSANILGFDIQHLGHVDGLWRMDAQEKIALYPSFSHIFHKSIHQKDISLLRTLIQEFRKTLQKHPASALYAPLGIGRHVDHRVTFLAASSAAAQEKRKILWYEDIPYRDVPGARELRLAEIKNHSFKQEIFNVSEEMGRKKIAACKAYRSQWDGIQKNGFSTIDYYQERFFTL